ncbi:hypothetical protein [Streptomyces sp. NK08204]|uniref:hypothetical protein n=1 Tax=Streptomyces sp. NK08204 TaxID=2873260 RepID=UPI001CECB1BC|nr:hypothetical protein [Streptomyces sp. NK08204]
MIGWLLGKGRELIGRVFRTGECLRTAGRLLGQAFLQRSREPLTQAPIGHVTAAESAARKQPPDARTDAEKLDHGVVDCCSPWACRGEAEPVPENSEPAS